MTKYLKEVKAGEQFSTTFTDEQILATADKTLCKLPHLQIAHDRHLLSNPDPDSIEYAKTWEIYLAAGGSPTMMNQGIDNTNWQRHRD